MSEEYIQTVIKILEYVETAGYNNFDSDTCKEIAACEEARKHDGNNYTPVILETLMQEDND